MSDAELAVVPPKESALAVFSADKGLEPYLAKIRSEIDAFTPDVSTKKGRDAIASIAHKVAKSKVAIDNVGKELVADLKDLPRKVDAERKRMRDLLDTWKDEVRQPLTVWEQAEESRVQGHRNAIEAIVTLVVNSGETSDALRNSLAEVEAVQIGEHWEEFEAEAARTKDKAVSNLRELLAAREKYEAEQAELARHRAESAERAQKEREAEMVREAEERARRQAEAQAQAERDAVTRREMEAKAAADRRELELKLQAEQAEKAAAQAEANRIAAEQRAERERVAAEQRHAQEVEQARAAEVQRQADESARIEREAKAREADKAHKSKINRAALEAFIAGGMPAECAKQAVTLIAKGQIPAVKISY